MSKKDIYVELDSTYAAHLISEVSASPNKMKTVDISQVPFNPQFPTSYTNKCHYATYATSACNDGSQVNLVLIYNREDHADMDQDMFAFYYNPNDNVPAVSGVKLPHGNYPGRTQDYSTASSYLNMMAAHDFEPLSGQTQDAVNYANKYIKDLKQQIDKDAENERAENNNQKG